MSEALMTYAPPEIPVEQDIPVDKSHLFPKTEQGEDLGVFAQNLLRVTRMPLTRITEIAYMPNTYNTHDVLGSLERGGPHEGRLSFYKAMEKIDGIGQFGVAVHESAHGSSPFDTQGVRINEDYGGEQNRLRAAENVVNVANQAAQTGIFLNGYHEYIYNLEPQIQAELLSKYPDITPEETHAVWEDVWREETHAIASELAATNRRHLAQVEEAQYRALQRQGLQETFVPLVSTKDATGKVTPSGIDQTLLDLTKFASVEEMVTHWQQVKSELYNKLTPFHKQKRQPRQPVPYFPPITERVIIAIVQPIRRNPWEEDLIVTLLPLPTLRRLTKVEY